MLPRYTVTVISGTERCILLSCVTMHSLNNSLLHRCQCKKAFCSSVACKGANSYCSFTESQQHFGSRQLAWHDRPMLDTPEYTQDLQSRVRLTMILLNPHLSTRTTGIYNPDSMYRVRVLAREGEAVAEGRDVSAVVRERLRTARAARRAIGIPSAETDTYRCVQYLHRLFRGGRETRFAFEWKVPVRCCLLLYDSVIPPAGFWR